MGGGEWNQPRQAKRQVLRYTPQELVSMYKPSSAAPLAGMENLFVQESQRPVSSLPFDENKVRMAWKAHAQRQASVGGNMRGPVGARGLGGSQAPAVASMNAERGG